MHGIWIVGALEYRPTHVFKKAAEDLAVDCIDHEICVQR
jgi:hypothetical protein